MKPLVIDNFQKGIAESPYVGFQDMRNVDIFSAPGSLKISQRLDLSSNIASLATGLIKWFAQDPDNADVYGVDWDGKVYRFNGTVWSIITGHGTTAANGEGLAIWKHYLFVARRTKLDVYALPSSPNGDAGTWYNDWQTLESSFGYDLHPMMAGTDDFLYIGNAQYVDTVNQVVGQTFDPGNPATYTYNAQDLELGSDYRVTTLEELGSDIAIGTLVGNNNRINIGNMFFWDGTSDSFSLNKTIHFAENGVWQTKNMGNTLYTIAGAGRTRLFASTFSQAIELKRLNSLNLTTNQSLRMFPAAIEQKDGELFFGVSRITGNTYPVGVYSYRNGAYVFRHMISTGQYGYYDGLLIGAIKLISGERYMVSWFDALNADYGVDILSANFYSGYEGILDQYDSFVISPIFAVGGDDDPKTFETCEIRMGKNLNAGDLVRISARYELSGTFTTILTINTVSQPLYVGRSVIHEKVSNLGSFKNIQIRIELHTAEDSTESPELMSIKLQ